jgi:hypothetical protein
VLRPSYVLHNLLMQSHDFPPPDFEVEAQLKRILASPRFKNAPNPSAFLDLTVRRALKGKKTTGTLFAGKFFQGVSDDVRVTALNLRNTLKKYYDKEGRTDVVVISYPKPESDRTIKPVEGAAYTPRFSHNPNHESYIICRVAYRSLDDQTQSSFYRAINLFTDLLMDDHEDCGALLGLVEAICAFCDRSWVPEIPKWHLTEDLLRSICNSVTAETPITAAQVSAIEICDSIFSILEIRAEHHWRYWAVRAQYLQQRNLPGSERCFSIALRLDRLATESFIPYMYFLIEINRCDEAVGLAQSYCNERVEDSFAVGEYGRLLCAAGRRKIGIGHLQVAIAIMPGNCSALQSLAVIRMIEKDVSGLASLLQTLKLYCDSDTFQWFLHYLEAHEQQFELPGCMAKLMLDLASADGSALAKF